MNEVRNKRLAKRIYRLVAELYQKDFRNPTEAFATFTGCELSNDGGYARVFVSLMGEPEEKKQTLHALQRASGFFRSSIRRNIRMQAIPQLQFVEDTSFENAQKTEELLNSLEGKEPATEAVSDREIETQSGS